MFFLLLGQILKVGTTFLILLLTMLGFWYRDDQFIFINFFIEEDFKTFWYNHKEENSRKIFVIIHNKKFYKKINFIRFKGRLKKYAKNDFWHPRLSSAIWFIKPYYSPSIIREGTFHLSKYPRESSDTFFTLSPKHLFSPYLCCFKGFSFHICNLLRHET